MNVLDGIGQRRSVRSFTKVQIERDKIDAILEAGTLAPSGERSAVEIFRCTKGERPAAAYCGADSVSSVGLGGGLSDSCLFGSGKKLSRDQGRTGGRRVYGKHAACGGGIGHRGVLERRDPSQCRASQKHVFSCRALPTDGTPCAGLCKGKAAGKDAKTAFIGGDTVVCIS